MLLFGQLRNHQHSSVDGVEITTAQKPRAHIHVYVSLYTGSVNTCARHFAVLRPGDMAHTSQYTYSTLPCTPEKASKGGLPIIEVPISTKRINPFTPILFALQALYQRKLLYPHHQSNVCSAILYSVCAATPHHHITLLLRAFIYATASLLYAYVCYAIYKKIYTYIRYFANYSFATNAS